MLGEFELAARLYFCHSERGQGLRRDLLCFEMGDASWLLWQVVNALTGVQGEAETRSYDPILDLNAVRPHVYFPHNLDKIMNTWDFYQCRIFLEERMRELPENMELVKAYVTLIEQKSQFDTAYFSQNADVQKNWSDNQREMNNSWHKFQADVTQKQIESGQYVPAALGYGSGSL